MSFLHDVIKIEFINIGYLPNIPYHLVSDAEMFEAFLHERGFFNDYYPCPCPALQTAYDDLRSYIAGRIQLHLEDETIAIPSWIYSYMLLRPITFESDEADISYLYDLLGLESNNGLCEFNEEVAEMCYQTSVDWLKRLPSHSYDRPPTMFGEPHVTKSLRLDQANALSSEVIT